MKKARILLTAMGVLAVVACSLAFKAKRSNVCYYERLDNPGICELFSEDLFTTGATIFHGNLWNTAIVKVSGECPVASVCNTKHVVTIQ